MTMLEQMAKAYSLRFRFGSRAAIEPNHPAHEKWWEDAAPLRNEIMAGMVAALKVLNSEVRAIRNRAEAEFPDQDGSDFEEFTVRVCELFDGMLKDAP